MSHDEPAPPFGLLRLFCLVAVLATAGAGAVHFLAVDAHRSHTLMAFFFLATGVAQLAWAALLLVRPSRPVLLAGIVGNAAVIGTWVISRTTGIPFVPGAEHAEPLGVRDVVATLLEGAAVGAAGLALLLPAGAAAVVLPAGRRAVAVAAAGVLALTGSAALAGPGHVHGHDEAGHAAHVDEPGHAHGDEAGQHGDGSGRHDDHGAATGDRDHGTGTSGHDHAAGTSGHDDGDGGGGHDDGDGGGGHDHGDGGGGHDDGDGGGGHDHGDGGGGHDHGDGGGGHDHGDGTGGHENHDHGTAERFPEPVFWGERKTLRTGPILLPPKRLGGEAHINRPGVLTNTLCGNCYITGIEPRMVYADGSTADLDTGTMLHHVVLMDSTRQDPTCERWNGIGLAGQRVFASGNERTPISLPRGFGFKMNSSVITYLAELMNHSDQWKNVYLEADFYTVPASRPGMKPVTPVWLDVANCSNSEYAVPAGRSTKTWSWPSKLTGRVIAAGGHVHDGGVGMTLQNGATDRRMCTSEAAYGTSGAFKGRLTDMSTCSWDRLGVVRKGQPLEISTIYDTPVPLRGVMGIMMLGLYETDALGGGTTAPAWNRRDPDTDPPDSGQTHDH